MCKATQQTYKKCISLLAMFLVVALAQLALLPQSAYAHTSRPAYECGGGTSGHCYGAVDWTGPSGSHLGGVQTDIVVVTVGCDNRDQGSGQCLGLFLNNETWMVDTTSSQVQYCNYGACWVEAGMQGGGSACAGNLYGSDCYFWADSRPNGGFYSHWNTMPSDNIGHHTRFKIKWLGNGSWDVSINPLASSDGYWDSTSTNNTIYPQNDEIGEELAGAASTASDGLYTDATPDFVNNKWADANVNYYYQTGCNSNCTAGSAGGAPPPYGYWAAVPNCCNNGGDWQAHTPQGS